MEQVDVILKGIRNSYMRLIGDYLDPGYHIICQKKNPLSEEEK